MYNVYLHFDIMKWLMFTTHTCTYMYMYMHTYTPVSCQYMYTHSQTTVEPHLVVAPVRQPPSTLSPSHGNKLPLLI